MNKKEYTEEEKKKISRNSTIIAIIVVLTIFIGIPAMLVSWIFSSDTEETNKLPDNIEIMSYAQIVLNDNLYNPKYSRLKEDYNIVSTGLRYKIEGNVTVNYKTEKFWMIIEFVDDSYKEYDLISLQVGNNIIYKK